MSQNNPVPGQLRKSPTSGNTEIFDGVKWMQSPYNIGVGGGGGSANSYISCGGGGGGLTMNASNYSDIKIEASNISVNGTKLSDILDSINSRLNILVPNPNKLEKYEALKEAYEHYKLMEAMLDE